MYYDKTQVILKKQIVEFEADKKSDKELDDSLIEIWEKLVHLTDEEWANYIKKEIPRSVTASGLFPQAYRKYGRRQPDTKSDAGH